MRRRQVCISFLPYLFLMAMWGNSSLLFAQNFGEMIRSSEPLTPAEELQTFHLPEGFEVQLFAAEPEIQKPMNLAFDAKGRLWVSGSNDYPFPNQTPTATDSIRILEDTDNDGRADKFTTFVEGITIPMGLYPYQDGVIAFSIPNITFYRDTDGDNRCDSQEVLYGPFDFSRDTHGLNNAFRRGLDGWIYACHGFNNHSKVAGRDGNTVSMQSGNTYRFRLDGSRIEHFTHGQVNPFGMTFNLQGDLFNSDCHTVPITLLLQGGFYPSFGKPHDGLGFVPPVMSHLHGSTAIAGLTQYTGQQFPVEYIDSLFVGNVMTSRIHRDELKTNGSTVRAVERPDFLTSTDPWFRPVDIQCGPDQALYVADFYNRIIGHYEVPLNHPGRDRHRARIWRISHKASAANKASTRPIDLTQLNPQSLIDQLQDSNLPSSYRIVEQLAERVGSAAIPLVRKQLQAPQSDQQHAYLFWVLQRLNDIKVEDLQLGFETGNELVKIHVMRVLTDISAWSPAHYQLASQGLQSSPMVQRAAANSLGQHPSADSVHPLLVKLQTADKQDLHLIHTCRLALRDILHLPNAYDAVAKAKLTPSETQLILDVSLAVNTEPSARFLFSHLSAADMSHERLIAIVTLAARQLPSNDLSKLIEISRSQFAENLDLQLEIFEAARSGLQKKGLPVTEELRAWGVELVKSVLSGQNDLFSDWTSVGLSGQPAINWDVEPRNTQAGKKAVPFVSSLPAGEKAVGILRSKSFTIPAQLVFDVCGHLGFPNQPQIPENQVSLHLDDDTTIKQVLAPRNDTAQHVKWDLKEYQGRQGYLQVKDGIDIKAYAWIAISTIQPPVVQLPTASRKQVSQRLRSAARIATDLQLSGFEEAFRHIATHYHQSVNVRYEALNYLNLKAARPATAGLIDIFREESLTSNQRDRIAALICEFDETQFFELLKTFPLSLQTLYARSLSRSPSGASDLIDLVERGILSPRVFHVASVATQLESLSDETIKNRFASIRSRTPEDSNHLQKLIQQRQKEFRPNEAFIQPGMEIFRKNCATCHSVNGEGKKIGPQLDGVGNRGLERILEDVLAPNRNIDVAFRSHTYLMEDGKIYSGLFRRTEGEATVIANQKGEEISISTADIAAEKVSPLSIMPENWGELISPEDFNKLLNFLLSQRQKPETN